MRAQVCLMPAFSDMTVCGLRNQPLRLYTSKQRERESKKTTAMFQVKRLRHAEGQQTEHNLLAGIGKLLTRDTAWGWRWITAGIAQTLFQKDNRIGPRSAIYLHLWNSSVWHFCNCRMLPSSWMEELHTMWKTALWILKCEQQILYQSKNKCNHLL